MLLLGLPNCSRASFEAAICAAFSNRCEKHFPVFFKQKTALILDFHKNLKSVPSIILNGYSYLILILGIKNPYLKTPQLHFPFPDNSLK